MRTHLSEYSAEAPRHRKLWFGPGVRDYHYHPLTKREVAQMHLYVGELRDFATATTRAIRELADAVKVVVAFRHGRRA